jgi:hypothetical protein
MIRKMAMGFISGQIRDIMRGIGVGENRMVWAFISPIRVIDMDSGIWENELNGLIVKRLS